MGFWNFGKKTSLQPPTIAIGRKKILVVDDEQYIREFYQELLTDEGYEAIAAKSGQEAIDLTLQQKPDLILLDIMMPEMDGMTVFNTLKTKSITTPVIFLTNAGDTTNLLAAAKQKAAGFLIKSDIEPKDLIKRIKDVLGSSSFQSLSDVI